MGCGLECPTTRSRNETRGTYSLSERLEGASAVPLLDRKVKRQFLRVLSLGVDALTNKTAVYHAVPHSKSRFFVGVHTHCLSPVLSKKNILKS